MHEIKRDEALIDYNIYGRGDTTLLFVHGSYIDQTYWDRQVEYFKENYRVVTFDLPGHGLSGKARKHWSMKGFAEDVIHLINELDLKNIILIGHSMGADVIVEAAATDPERLAGLIVVDNMKNAATPLPPEFEKQIDGILDNLKKDFAGTNEQYARMALLTDKTPAAIVDRVVKDYREAYQPMGQELMSQFFEVTKMEAEVLPKLSFILNLVNVDYIPTNEEPLKQFAGSGYRLLHLNGTCHYPMLEHPDELNSRINEVITGIKAGLAQ